MTRCKKYNTGSCHAIMPMMSIHLGGRLAGAVKKRKGKILAKPGISGDWKIWTKGPKWGLT